jgi:hypothetical protein
MKKQLEYFLEVLNNGSIVNDPLQDHEWMEGYRCAMKFSADTLKRILDGELVYDWMEKSNRNYEK